MDICGGSDGALMADSIGGAVDICGGSDGALMADNIGGGATSSFGGGCCSGSKIGTVASTGFATCRCPASSATLASSALELRRLERRLLVDVESNGGEGGRALEDSTGTLRERSTGFRAPKSSSTDSIRARKAN